MPIYIYNKKGIVSVNLSQLIEILDNICTGQVLIPKHPTYFTIKRVEFIITRLLDRKRESNSKRFKKIKIK